MLDSIKLNLSLIFLIEREDQHLEEISQFLFIAECLTKYEIKQALKRSKM